MKEKKNVASSRDVTEKGVMYPRGEEQEIERERELYRKANKKHKGEILNSYCERKGCHRKSAIRFLNRKVKSKKKRSRAVWGKYNKQKLLPIIQQIWLASEQMCGRRLQAQMGLWVEKYEEYYGPRGSDLKEQLLSMSSATLDRMLRRSKIGKKGKATTRPGTIAIRQIVPHREGKADTSQVGAIEVDTVAHCGGNMGGSFVYSLTFTDLYSGWTCNRATWNKGSAGILEQMRDIERGLPFQMKSFHSDNGSEFMNWVLWEYLQGKHVKQSRSRSYQKNDNAHCEEKNWTHVRQLFGYDRFGHPELVEIMNKIYKDYEKLMNYFCPSFKLKSKERQANGKWKKVYEKELLTPCDRLLNSNEISMRTKEWLEEGKRKNNPFELKQKMEKGLKKFYRLLQRLDAKRAEETRIESND